MDPAEISGTSMAKLLASCKQSSRNSGLRLLSSILSNQNADLSLPDLINIWKGLFFCIWHSDKPENQFDLINNVSALLSSLPPQIACIYLESFLITIRREWNGIDFLRLDKFYLLIRRFLHHFFVLLGNNSWNLDLISRMGSMLSHGSASGVNYHIAEIFLDEIAEFLPLDAEIMDLMLNSFILVVQSTTDRVLVNKIKVSIFDRLAVNGLKLLGDVEAGGDVEKFGKIALGMGFSRKFFSLASAAETQQGNRKVFFDLHDRYFKLENDVKKSGLDILLKQLDVCEMETAKVFTTDSCGDNGRIKTKKKKIKKTLDGYVANSKIKKKKKKSLDSFTESNGADPGEMNKSKKKNKKLVDLSAEDIDAEALRDSGAIANTKNHIFDSSDSNDMINFDDTLLSKKKKKSLDSFTESNGADPGEMNKSKKKNKNFLDSSVEDIDAEALRDSGAIANTKNDIFDSSDSNDMINFDDTLLSKKKEKSLDSFTESNGAGEMNKSKKKNKKFLDSPAEDIDAEALRDSGAIVNTENHIFDSSDSNDMINFDDTLLSNLQNRFEKVAAEAGMSSGIVAKVSKKRKRATNSHKKQVFLNPKNVDGGTETGENDEMNVKKVRFSMNQNLIWKPQNPLPPQNLRLPPSVTPRGSALKKGLSPGPIRESPPTVKKIKVKGSSVKKARKNLRTVSSFRLLQGFSV